MMKCPHDFTMAPSESYCPQCAACVWALLEKEKEKVARLEAELELARQDDPLAKACIEWAPQETGAQHDDPLAT